MSNTIEFKATHRSNAAMLAAVLERGTEEGKRLAREELYRMAEAADMAAQLLGEASKRGAVLAGLEMLKFEMEEDGEAFEPGANLTANGTCEAATPDILGDLVELVERLA